MCVVKIYHVIILHMLKIYLSKSQVREIREKSCQGILAPDMAGNSPDMAGKSSQGNQGKAMSGNSCTRHGWQPCY